VGGVVLGLIAIWLRLEQRHHGLLYPDGYQYLLMARGIGDHLRPTTVLGLGGDAYVPSFDAATKPWFAAVVAAVAELGVALRSAGGLVAAVSAGLASVAGALLVHRLTRSAAAAAMCGVALLASPTLGFWWGFAGPDGMAVALTLLAAWLASRSVGKARAGARGAAVDPRGFVRDPGRLGEGSGGAEAGVGAAVCGAGEVRAGARGAGVEMGAGVRRWAVGRAGFAAGVAAGLAVTTRPELVVVVVACAAAGGAGASMRATAVRAGVAAVATVGVVYAVFRPPLEWSWQLVLAPVAGLVGAGVLVLVWRAGATRVGTFAALATFAGALAVLGALDRAAAAVDVALAEWPLVLAAGLGAAALWRADAREGAADGWSGSDDAGMDAGPGSDDAGMDARPGSDDAGMDAGAGSDDVGMDAGPGSDDAAAGACAGAGGVTERSCPDTEGAAVPDRGGSKHATIHPRADGKRTLLVLLTISGLLVAVYAYKNPGSERYVANVLALLGVLVALGVGAASARREWLLVAAMVALVALDAALANTPPPPGTDPFDDVAPQLAALPPGAIVSATPDAYAVLLPGRPSRRLRAGARGYVVLDGGQRTYAPGFTARGTVVFRSYPFYGFVRPDGTVDRGPTTVVRGVVVPTQTRR
jgi:hypothetical protein